MAVKGENASAVDAQPHERRFEEGMVSTSLLTYLYDGAEPTGLGTEIKDGDVYQFGKRVGRALSVQYTGMSHIVRYLARVRDDA